MKELIKSNSTLIEINKRLVEENLKLKEIIKNLPKVYNGNYCWTHGYRLSKWNNSKTCPKKDKDHKDEENRENIMGCSEKNRKWREMVNKY